VKPPCAISGCVREQWARTFCNRHYARWRRYGDPLAGRHLADSYAERLLASVATAGEGCWLWQGTVLEGYGVFNWQGGRQKAHRAVYELLRGQIPDGKELDHLCRVTQCVRPSHLEPVTHGENVLRGESPSARCARKTHCKKGHAFDEANTRYDRHGHRTCRTCDRMRAEARYSAKG